jgi:FkbM family methyltransferase
LEYKVRKSNKPIVFRDWAGHLYWQYPGDHIRNNWKRKSVSDANHIIRYILNHVKPGWTCIDIGANIGSVSIPLWKRVGPTGRVISVEADPNHIDKIKANLRLNNCPDNYVDNVAIAESKGTVQLRCYPESSGWQTLGDPSFAKDHTSVVIDVPAINFEELLEIHRLGSVDFVKIDVEGAEILVLRGMRTWLKKKEIGCVIFEVNHLMLEGMNSSVSELMSLWEEFDYELWRLDGNGTPAALIGTWPDNLIGDCLALPRR